jgi:polysaccharide export outer membrane protein
LIAITATANFGNKGALAQPHMPHGAQPRFGTGATAAMQLAAPQFPHAAPPQNMVHAPIVQPHAPSVAGCGSKQFYGFHCAKSGPCANDWNAARQIPFDKFAQGEYVGPARTAHVSIYRLRPDDQIDCVFRITRDRSLKPYELNVGDQVQIESFADERLRRDLIVQPDGTITLGLLGQVLAAGMTVDELRKDLDERYKQYYNNPSITVTPIAVNTKLEDLRATVDGRQGFGGQSLRVQVTPDGTIALPAVENIPAQGLSLSELKREIDARYEAVVEGIEVTPVLTQRAPRYIYVVGEVLNPGRFTLEGPTTLIQSIALAGSWNVGANIEQVVVFRRDENWCLMATMLDVRGALLGRRPCPADEIWLRDGDIVVVPKSKILLNNNFINLVFTNGIYGVLPGQATAVSFGRIGRL